MSWSLFFALWFPMLCQIGVLMTIFMWPSFGWFRCILCLPVLFFFFSFLSGGDNDCRIARSTILNIQHIICDKRMPMLRFIDCLHLFQIKIKSAFILIFVIRFHFSVFGCRFFFLYFPFSFIFWFSLFALFYTHSVSMTDSNCLILSTGIHIFISNI